MPVELTDPEAVTRALEQDDPDAILHAAAISAADAVRLDPGLGHAVNVEATARLAAWCAQNDRRIVFTSTDLVFDGGKAWNREEDPAEPIMAYGRTKREAEPLVTAVPRGLAARMSLLFGPSRCGRPSYFDLVMGKLKQGEVQTLFEDEFRTPLDLKTAANALTRLVESDLTGLIHVAGRERVSRYELMRRTAAAFGADPGLVRSNRRSDVTLAGPRPADASMDTTQLQQAFPDIPFPPIEEAVAGLIRVD